MIRPTVARVDVGAIKRNFRQIVEHLARERSAGPPGVIAVVKANAYGHGAAQVARALEDAGADLLACADIEEGAVLLRDSRVWWDRVRPGLLLYGIVPPPLAATLPLTPVITLGSRVVAVKGLRSGEAVGYGARFTAQDPRTIAIVPAGYADGLDL